MDAPAALPAELVGARGRVRERLLLAVFAGGAAGGAARALLERAVPASGHGWPWATFTANVVGTVLLAYFATRLQERLPPSTYPRPFLGTGLCGALTTFSTLQVETIALVRNGHAALGIAYAATSIAVGLVAVHTVTAFVRRETLR